MDKPTKKLTHLSNSITYSDIDELVINLENILNNVEIDAAPMKEWSQWLIL